MMTMEVMVGYFCKPSQSTKSSSKELLLGGLFPVLCSSSDEEEKESIGDGINCSCGVGKASAAGKRIYIIAITSSSWTTMTPLGGNMGCKPWMVGFSNQV